MDCPKWQSIFVWRNNEMKIKKAKKGILNAIFSRAFILVILLLVQIIILGATITRMQEYATYIYGGLLILGVMTVVYIINNNGNPDFKVTWMLLIMITPIIGTVFYLFVKTQPGTAYISKRLKEISKETKPYMLQDKQVMDELRKEKAANANLATYMEKRVSFPVYKNTMVKYFPLGEDKFEEMKKQLRQATKFIFMEYFIIEKGRMWNEILEILKEKVLEGVDVRVMYDGMCSMYLLPYHYDKELQQYGIKCKQFSKILPILSSHQNNRDHRKICVIDGEIAFTGGINLADEYINETERYGHWKDTAVILRGAAVQSFTMMFLQMWNVSEKTLDDFSKYLTIKTEEMKQELGYVLPYGDSPYDLANPGEQVYLHILNHAKKYVHIMSPYLIIGEDLLQTLEYTAMCGVEVILIMPHIPDKWYAYVVAKTYYKTLIDAGVQIYEYTPGFVHAKMFISDDDTATVGTINLDYRSLYHHFECGTWIYDNSVIRDIERDFQETLKKCQKVTEKDLKKQSIFEKVAGKVLRLIAPLM